MNRVVADWLFDPTIGKIVAALAGVIIIIILVKFAHRSVLHRIKSTNHRYRAKKLMSFGGYLLGVLLLATVFSDRLGGLTVAFGVAGAGIAFALQEVIASVAGWLAVSFGNFYTTGDRVQLGGITGDVIDVGILRTTVMETGQWVKGDLYNGRVVRIANSFIFKEPVFNYSGDFPFLWDEIQLPIRYGSDVRFARECFQRIAFDLLSGYTAEAKLAWNEMVQRYMIEDASVEPKVTLIATDNWLEFTIRYIVDYKLRRSTKDELFTRLLDEIASSEGRIALASATYEIVALPPVDVRWNGKTG